MFVTIYMTTKGQSQGGCAISSFPHDRAEDRRKHSGPDLSWRSACPSSPSTSAGPGSSCETASGADAAGSIETLRLSGTFPGIPHAAMRPKAEHAPSFWKTAADAAIPTSGAGIGLVRVFARPGIIPELTVPSKICGFSARHQDKPLLRCDRPQPVRREAKLPLVLNGSTGRKQSSARRRTPHRKHSLVRDWTACRVAA